MLTCQHVNNSPVNYTGSTGHWIDDGCSTSGCSGKSDAIVITKLIGKHKIYSNTNYVNQDSYESSQVENLHFEALHSGSGVQKDAVAAADAFGAVNYTLSPFSIAANMNATPYNVFFWLNIQLPSDTFPYTYTQLDVKNRSNGTVNLMKIGIAGRDLNTSTFCKNCPDKDIYPQSVEGSNLSIYPGQNTTIPINYAFTNFCTASMSILYTTNPADYGLTPYYAYEIGYP